LAEVAVVDCIDEALVQGGVGGESGGFVGREGAVALEGGERGEMRLPRHGDGVGGG
jgi:hypothetical protein